MVELSDTSGKFSAKLPKGSPEECNCWMLRRWLQCRGGRTTGKKAALQSCAKVKWWSSTVVRGIIVKQNYSMVYTFFFQVLGLYENQL